MNVCVKRHRISLRTQEVQGNITIPQKILSAVEVVSCEHIHIKFIFLDTLHTG